MWFRSNPDFEYLPSYMSRSKRLKVTEKQLPEVDLRTMRMEEYWSPPVTPMTWEETMAIAYMPFVDMPGLLEALLKLSAYEKSKGLSLTIPTSYTLPTARSSPAFLPRKRSIFEPFTYPHNAGELSMSELADVAAYFPPDKRDPNVPFTDYIAQWRKATSSAWGNCVCENPQYEACPEGYRCLNCKKFKPLYP